MKVRSRNLQECQTFICEERVGSIFTCFDIGDKGYEVIIMLISLTHVGDNVPI